MKHEDFHIGTEFWTVTGPMRCTDVGTRTIVAIKLGPREVGYVRTDCQGVQQRGTVIDDDPSWLNGPPYAVAETVFDEHDIEACYRTRAEMLSEYADEGDVRGTV